MDRSVNTMNLVVETTSIADDAAAILDSPPESCLTGSTVGAAGVRPLLQVTVLARSLLHQRSVRSVHLVIETTSVAEIVARVISSPERSVGDTTVNTLSGAGHRRW